MFARPVFLASIVLGALVFPRSRFAPTTTRYHIDLKAEQTVDLTGFGGPTQHTNLGLNAWVALTLTDSAGGKVVHAIVDSLKADTDAPQITALTADSAKGGMIHGFLDPTGRVKNLTSRPASNTLMASVQGVVNGIFPRIKSGAKAGDQWVDTTEVTNTLDGNDTKVALVISYTAEGTESAGGRPALTVRATSTSVISGTMQNPMAGTMGVEGTGTGEGVFQVGVDGRFLGGTLTNTLNQKLTVAAAPAPIPVKSTQRLTITALP